jgi:4-diphosphocytidyl-2-C-methyl-D-erythritol kinase
MICYPNAKINLGLNVVSKRADGYHNLESIFLPIDFCDVLEVLPSMRNGIQLTVHGIEVKGDISDNLVVKAYHLLNDKFHIGGVEVHLIKNIPTGAGMGGGSSNGVFMLKALCELFALPVSHDVMFEWAASLGSDCPFFLFNRPSFVVGRGDVVEPLSIDLSEYEVCVVHPGIHISTANAFASITPEASKFDLKKSLNLPLCEWKRVFTNDFQTHALESSPIIGEIIDELYDSGAMYASMTGSGSAVYGVYLKGETKKNEFPYLTRVCRLLTS